MEGVLVLIWTYFNLQIHLCAPVQWEKQWDDVTWYLPPWATRCCCCAGTAYRDVKNQTKAPTSWLKQDFVDGKFKIKKRSVDLTLGTIKFKTGDYVTALGWKTREDKPLTALPKDEKRWVCLAFAPSSPACGISCVCVYLTFTGLLDNVPTQISVICMNMNFAVGSCRRGREEKKPSFCSVFSCVLLV